MGRAEVVGTTGLPAYMSQVQQASVQGWRTLGTLCASLGRCLHLPLVAACFSCFPHCLPLPLPPSQGGEDIGLDGGDGGLKWEGMGTSDF